MIKVLENDLIDSGIRLNIVMTLGDLFNKFPIELETYSKNLFKLLRDGSTDIRKETLTIISHMVLNGMILIKHEIADIILLSRDEDPSIRDQV